MLSSLSADFRFGSSDNALKPIPSVYDCLKEPIKVDFSCIKVPGKVLKFTGKCSFEMAFWDHGSGLEGTVFISPGPDPLEGVRSLFPIATHRVGDPIRWIEKDSFQINLLVIGLKDAFLKRTKL